MNMLDPQSPVYILRQLFTVKRGLHWMMRPLLSLLGQCRLSYLPPLMIYLAAGLSGLTAIVGTFFVKEYLGLSAEFMAALGFWALLPWSMKMPMGHLVDLFWRQKAYLVVLSAGLIALSLLIMIGLLADTESMQTWMSVENWYVLSVLLAPLGYVIQDTVADAMTVEAVPDRDEDGLPLSAASVREAHTTMQSLGRVAIIAGTCLVALLNVLVFRDAADLDKVQKAAVYLLLYKTALMIPVISVIGVILGAWLHRKQRSDATWHHRPKADFWILGGGLVFLLFSVGMGLANFSWSAEAVFSGSMAIVIFLMWKITRHLPPALCRELFATAGVIFVFRAMPSPGAGASWWMIDVLAFDQQFLSWLSLLGSVLAMFGIFLFRRYMAEQGVIRIFTMLTLVGTVLSLPNIGLFYGVQHWTAALTGGVVDARFIALVDTALESPLGQVAMIPMLAWIARCAPSELKASYFAVMTAFTNLALSLAQLLTKYLNQYFVVTREVRDVSSGQISVPADYSQLGHLFIATTVLGLMLPLFAVIWARRFARLKHTR